MILYAATSNLGKLAEFAASASSAGDARGEEIAVLALPNLKQIPEPAEDATTFQGNADLKAIAYSLAAPGLLVFADDSGLEVEALGNRPGVRSARFADDLGFDLPSTNSPASCSVDDRNNRCVLSLLDALPNASRAASFVCAHALARDGHVLLLAHGTVAGQLLHHPRGSDGFGYDPLFLIPSLHRTLAEVPREQKWHLSHRGNAFRSLLAQLRSVRL
jgi:XTP/dITP diphosphohydrolase